MGIKSNLFEITQFCLLHFVLLVCILISSVKAHFLPSDQYTWFSHVQSHMVKLILNVVAVPVSLTGQGHYK